MMLFRGIRHPHGRIDVIVCGPGGEQWLRGMSPTASKTKPSYDWGNGGPGARLLALHVLEEVLGSEYLAATLAPRWHGEWSAQIVAERWAIPDWDVLAWSLDAIEELLKSPSRSFLEGGLPWTSDN